MGLKQNFELMASYNQWMNEKLYRAAEKFSQAELVEDRGAFFGSILGSLNHILVGDTIWLKRFASHPVHYNSLDSLESLPVPSMLTEILYEDFSELRKARVSMDEMIVNWSLEVEEGDYERALPYRSTKGLPFTKVMGALVQHFYNHQTHHRGQVTTLLSQIGIDVGITDMLAIIPDEKASD